MNKRTKSWQHNLKAIAERALGKQIGLSLWQKYHELFSVDYQSLISPRYALNDILQLERLITSHRESVSLVKPYASQSNYRLHFYSQQKRYLDEFIPVLENMHLRVMDQVQFTFAIDGESATIKSFTVKATHNQYAPLSQLKNRLLETIQVVMEGRVENDALNKLCVLAGIN